MVSKYQMKGERFRGNMMTTLLLSYVQTARGDSHMKGAWMLLGNFELNP